MFKTLSALPVLLPAVLAAFGLLAGSRDLCAQSDAPAAGLIQRSGIAVSEKSGKVYIADSAHNSITVLRADGVTKSIPAGVSPIAIAVNDRTGTVYSANAGDRSVSVIDGASDEVVATARTAARPYAIAVDDVHDEVFVSNTFSNMLTVIRGRDSASHNVKTGSADGLLVDPAHARVYLLGYESDALTVFDETTETTSKLPAGAMHLWAEVLEGDTLYVSHVQDSSVAAIDTGTGTIQNMETGSMPCALALDAPNHRLYAVSYAGASVTAIDTAKNTPLWTVQVGGHPQALALDPVRHRLYVADAQASQVAVVDTQRHTRLKTIPTEGHPYAVALQPGTHRVVVAMTGKNSYAELPKD